MTTGNAQQSAWSAQFHSERGDVSLPCPAAEFGGHEGNCKSAHPRGITLLPAGGWAPTAAGDGWTPPYIESYV